MDMAADRFFVQGDNGVIVKSSILNAFNKIPDICATKAEIINSNESDGTQRIHDQLEDNIIGFFDSHRTHQWLNYARSWEIPIEDLFQMASTVKSWTEFSLNIDKMVEKQKYILSRGRTED
jgi:hypothetical protein